MGNHDFSLVSCTIRISSGVYPSLCLDLKSRRNWLRCSCKPFQPQLPGKRHQALTWTSPGHLVKRASPLDPRCLPFGPGWVLSPKFSWRPFFFRAVTGCLACELRTAWPVSCSEASGLGMWASAFRGNAEALTPSAVGHAEGAWLFISFSGGYASQGVQSEGEFGTTCGCVRLAFLYFTILSVPGQPANSVR